MLMKNLLRILLLLLPVLPVEGQKRDWQPYLDALNDFEDFQSTSWDDYEELFSQLAEHPLNLNAASREDLEQLPFLTAQQIEAIQAYIYTHGQLKSMGELAMIPEVDYCQRRLLECFATAASVATRDTLRLADVWRNGHHELAAYGKIPFYERRGDKSGYLGYRYRHWLRYDFSSMDRVRIGLVGAQDAGEPFFSGRNGKGYDYYSFYFQLKRTGRLKNLVLGRYRLRFGMGLVMNADLSFGKMGMLTTLGRNANSVRVHSSRSPANYLQGAAATVQLVKGLDVTLFASARKIDATLSATGDSIVTVVTSGYHRTQREMEKKDNATQTAWGGNVRYFKNGFHVGATALSTGFSKPLAPNRRQQFRRWYPGGRHFWNAGVDYGYTSRKLNLGGETATGDSHALATVNTASLQLGSQLTLMALQRFYSYKFYSLFGNSFADGGSVQNESGVYVGATWQPRRTLTLMAYTDYAHFAWPKYQADAASNAWDNMLSVAWQPGRLSVLARYRVKAREKNNADKTGLVRETTHRGKLALGYDFGIWQTRTQGDVAYSRYKADSFGWMASQMVTIRLKWLRGTVAGGYFHTDDYASRIYAYEPGLRYNFFFPAFYGEGIHYMAQLSAGVGAGLTLSAKLAVTDCFDRGYTGSGLERVDRSSRTDLEVQALWKF